MDLGLKDAKVLVTASSKGLGAATARCFAQEGARVVICGRKKEELDKTAADILRETGQTVVPIVADVSQAIDAQRLVDEAASALDGLDILITNAGGPPPGKFEALRADQWESAVQLTLMSAVNLIRAALPYLKQSQKAAILTITSETVKQPNIDLTLSSSIRMAVIGLTKTLAFELGPQGIRVNGILPGWTRTERVEQILESRAARNQTTTEQEFEKQIHEIPLGRLGLPHEFANAAVFLCSPAASFIHGAMVPVDGGTIRASL
jgi:3-oxoacyl-[acyl-carrier protein] reductase